MRTGAIFARGSCRALKWMALFGVVFALGATHAAAQTFTASYAAGSATVTVTASEAVKSSGSALAFSAFTITGVGGAATATSASSTGGLTFTVTFTNNITGVPKLTYTPPPAGQSRLQTDPGGTSIGAFTIDVKPTTPSIPVSATNPQTATVGTLFERILPEAVAAEDITYSVTGTPTLPTSLAFTAAERKLAGTPVAADEGEYSVVYSAESGGNTSTRTFILTIVEAGDVTAPIDESGRITKIEVGGAVEKTIGGVDRMHVEEGDIDEVTVTIEWTADQLRQIWDGLPAGTSRPAPVMVELDMMPVLVPSLAWVSEAETEVGHDDVTIGTGLAVAIPARPKTDTDRGLYTNSGSTSIAFNEDHDAENEAFKITVTNIDAFEDRSLAETADVHVIEDDEDQGIELTRVNKGVIYEGGPNQVFEVVAKPARVDLPLDVRFDLEDVTGETVKSRDNTIDKAVGTIPIGTDGEETVTLTLDGNDANRTDDKIKLHAEVVDYARDTGAFTAVGEKEVEITVIDVHKIPPFAVEPKTVTVTEGKNTTLTYTIDRNPPDTVVLDPETLEYTSEELMLTVMAMDASMADDFRIVAPKVTIEEHDGKSPWEQTAEVEVEIRLDDDLGMETLVLEATLEGTVAANGPGMRPDPMDMMDMRLKEATTATITIEDATVKLVEAKTQAELDIKEAGADAELTVDDMVAIMGSALFDSVDGATVIYSAMSSAPSVASASVSGGEIMVTAKGKGDAMITVEASAKMGSGVTANPQTEPDRASVDIPIAVALAPLSISLEGPDAGMNLVEGMSYTLTARANRPVEMDTMVELVQTDGTAAPADYKVEPITILMGESMGTTKLMVEEDGMMENEGNMAEMLTLEGRIGAMKTTNSLMFYLWDAAVPALPVIAQLLLAALMAVGGYRRYRRR